MSGKDIVWEDCRSCSRSTRHEILSNHEVETNPEDYHEKDSWQIIRCQGCYTFGFRHQHEDFEMVEEIEDGVYSHEQSVSIYPSVFSRHRQLSSIYYLPPLIRKVYKQTLSALSEKAYVLASIGLRACIEAVCSHLKVSGANLEKRIDQLFKVGHVSNGDKRRLHAIRFLGNDAAHEVREPKESDIRIALEIVEHLLNSVFILEQKAGSLDTVAENFDDFKKLIISAARKHEGNNSIALAALLGRKRRLVGQSFEEFESKLREEIESGVVDCLKLAHTSVVNGKEIQLYDVIQSLPKPFRPTLASPVFE